MDKKLSTANFSFSFEGSNEIDASNLAMGLSALNSLVIETQETSYPDSTCNLKVKASREGSFEVDLSVLALTAISMFSPENINYAANITKLILQFFDIKKHIGNKKPKVTKHTDKTIVENATGQIEEYSDKAYSFFANAKIETAIVQIVEAGQKAPDVTGLNLRLDDGEQFSIGKTEFENMNIPVIGDMDVPTQTIASTDTFYIKQATVLGDAQWVLMKERPLHAKMLDTNWLDEYRKGKHPIIPGVRIRADMVTVLQIGENGFPIEGKATHEIIKVHDTIYPEEHKQMELEY